MGLANPSIGNHGSMGKDVQFLQKYLTCYNSRAHGYERSRSLRLVATVDGGWLGIEINLTVL